jgi:type II secretory pathway pseudopilin PulG
LLVVIALIGVLVSALMPSLKRSMTQARATVCKHDLREVGISLMAYRYENDGWLPTVEKPPGPIHAVGAKVEPWFAKLYPTYFNDLLILTCPEDPYKYRMMKVGDQHARDPYVADYSSYGMNRFLATAAGGMLADLDRHGPSRPSDTILLADSGPDYVTAGVPRPAGQPVVGPDRNMSLLSWDDGADPFSGDNAQSWLTMRHGHGINLLTATAGVQSARTREIMSEPISRYYHGCASGGCTLCNDLRLFHYTFARDRLFWWTGPPPVE